MAVRTGSLRPSRAVLFSSTSRLLTQTMDGRWASSKPSFTPLTAVRHGLLRWAASGRTSSCRHCSPWALPRRRTDGWCALASGDRKVMGRFILRYRAPIGIALLLITGIFGYYASKLTIGTSFIDFFPKNHPYVQLYHNYERYGGAQRLTLMVQVKHGDIYNYKTLRKIQDMTYDLDL